MLSASRPTKPKRDQRAYYQGNRERFVTYQRAYRAQRPGADVGRGNQYLKDHPEKASGYQRKARLKREYGLTREQYDAMYAAQEQRCAICSELEADLECRLCIDHDHSTGKVRALLCRNCNFVLGHCKENTNVLKAAISYLEKHDAE